MKSMIAIKSDVKCFEIVGKTDDKASDRNNKSVSK